MIKFRDQLFIFGRHENTERYDAAFNVWSELNLRRDYSKLVVLKGEIYAVSDSIIEKYNVKRCTWETLTHLVKAVERMLVLLQPAVICTCLAGGFDTERNTSQKLRGLTPWKTSGRK